MNNPINNITKEVNSLNLKSYLLKVLSYWKIFVISIITALLFAKYKNMMNVDSYSINTQISIDEKTNPLLSSSTNISFNWGGASNVVETIKSKFRSRTHNENVVRETEFYINYLQTEKILWKERMVDVYGIAPFKIHQLDPNSYQALNQNIEIEFVGVNSVKVSTAFSETLAPITLYNYQTGDTKQYQPRATKFSKVYNIQNPIVTPFASFELNIIKPNYIGQKYIVNFGDFNGTVANLMDINIATVVEGTNILDLSLGGANKFRLIDYLNKTVEVMIKNEKKSKIVYAINTKNFIDSLYNIESEKLNSIQQQLINFKKNNAVTISSKGEKAYDDLTTIEQEKKEISEYNQFLNRLKRNSFTNDVEIKNIPLQEIKDVSLQTAFVELINQLLLKEKLISNDVYPSHPEYVELLKNIRLSKHNIKNKIEGIIAFNNQKINNLKTEINQIEAGVSDLPIKEHQLLQLEKQFELAETNYSDLKQRRYDAGSAIAANTSNIEIIDSAKDVGQGPLESKTNFNYIVAILLGTIFPLIIITIAQLIDDNIYTIEDISNSYTLPILGIVAKNTTNSYTVMVDYPNSSIAESFRTIRSSIPFLLSKKSKNDCNTILISSTVGGEGKSLNAINIASSFAVSGKKTILIGFDLRKPKLHNYLNIENNLGVVNYLIDEVSLDQIITKSKINNLDFILSGPIPPNPSELILSDKTTEMFDQLKNMYDYIVIDTPPIGLITDGLDLLKFADVNIYIARQGVTKKSMLKLVQNKYNSQEIKNLGIVLNDYDNTVKYGMRYGYEYGYGNYNENYGYHTNPKPKSITQKIKAFYKKIKL